MRALLHVLFTVALVSYASAVDICDVPGCPGVDIEEWVARNPQATQIPNLLSSPVISRRSLVKRYQSDEPVQEILAAVNHDACGPANCYPFATGVSWPPHYIAIYKNLPPAELLPGDIIAFDTGAANENIGKYAIALAHTDNGGVVETEPYTTVLNYTLPPSTGDNIVGSFELRFVMTEPFSFRGGGLAVRLSLEMQHATSIGFTVDYTCQMSLVCGNDNDSSDMFVRRFYRVGGDGTTAAGGPAVNDGRYIPVFKVVRAIPKIPPTANAGQDRVINSKYAVDKVVSVTLDGSSTNPEGGPVTYTWTGDALTTPVTGASPTVSLPFGTHQLTLTVTNSNGDTGVDTVAITVNALPVANAGEDVVVSLPYVAGGTGAVALDGSGSSDYENGQLQYQWSGIVSATGVNPTVALPFGSHNILLTVTDPHGAISQDAVNATVNAIPVANAGVDQIVASINGVADVVLDGTASFDADGHSLQYAWTGAVTATGANPAVLLPSGVHTITLTVTDPYGASSSDTVKVIVNSAPIANAGADKLVSLNYVPGQTANVALDGSASSDPDNDALTYVWSGAVSATGAKPTVSLPFGVHAITLTVTDPQGASDTDTMQVRVNANPVARAGMDETRSLEGEGNDSAEITLNGSQSSDHEGDALTFSWSNGGSITASGPTPTITFPVGTHTMTLTVTDAYGGSSTDQVVVKITSAPVANAGEDQVVSIAYAAAGKASVQLSGSASSIYTDLTYTWTGAASATGASPTVMLPFGLNTMTLKVTDAFGGSDTDTMTVFVNAIPAAKAGADQTVSSTYSEGKQINVYLDGSQSSDFEGANLIYVWTRGETELSSNAQATASLPFGTHTLKLTVIDPYGATSSDEVTVFVNAIPVADAGAKQVVSAEFVEGGTVQATLNGSGSSDYENESLTYEWTGPVTAQGVNPTVALPFGKNTINLKVTDPHGASSTSSVVVIISGAPAVSAGDDQVISAAYAEGATVEVQLAATTASYHSDDIVYSWSSGAITASGRTPTVSVPFGVHTFTVTATDPHGATDSDDVVITVNAIPVAKAGNDKVISATYVSGGTVPVTLDGSFSSDFDNNIVTYIWSGAASAYGSHPTVQLPFGKNELTLTVTDAYGAQSSDNVTIIVSGIPVANAGPDQVVSAEYVQDGTVDVTLAGSGSGHHANELSYKWEGVVTATGATPVVSLPFGVHTLTLTATDPHNASSTDTVTITVNAAPVANAGADQVLSRTYVEGGSVIVTLDGSASSDHDNDIVSYVWSGAVSATGAVKNVALPFGKHVMTLTVTDAHGASSSDDVQIIVSGIPVANAGEDRVVSAPYAVGETVDVTLSGSGSGYHANELTYTWSGVVSATGATPTVSLPFGVHTLTLTATDPHGASSSDQVKITVNAIPVANAGSRVVVSAPKVDGAVVAATLDGTGSTDFETDALTFSWTGPVSASGPAPTVQLPFGKHTMTLTVTDIHGASSSDDVTVIISGAPVANAGEDQVVSSTFAAGKLVPVVLRGSAQSYHNQTGGITYTWSGSASGEGAELATELPFGIHQIQLAVSDPHGATDTDDVQVIVNAIPVADAGEDIVVSTVYVEDGRMNVVLDGTKSKDHEGGSLTYSWTGIVSATGVTPVVSLPFGVHTLTLTVTDEHGASSTDTVTVRVNAKPVAQAGGNRVESIEYAEDALAAVVLAAVVLDASASSDHENEALTYKWTGANGFSSTNAQVTQSLTFGSYDFTLTVTDPHGATSSDTITVIVNAIPVAKAGSDMVKSAVYVEGGFLSFDVDGSESHDYEGGELTYEWSVCAHTTGVNATIDVPFGTHTLTLTVTDEHGASSSDSISVIANAFPVAHAGGDRVVSGPHGAEFVTFQLDGSQSTDREIQVLKYTWTGAAEASGMNAEVSLPFGSHTFTLTVEDPHGATSTDEVTIFVNTQPVANAGEDQLVSAVYEEDGTVDVTLNGSSSFDDEDNELVYTWSGIVSATGPQPTVSLPFGTHTMTLTVTDTQGASSTDDVVITVNAAPVANAGGKKIISADKDLSSTVTVNFDGSQSTDLENEELTYVWSGAVTGTGVTQSANLPFGKHMVTLTVTDPHGASSSDEIVVIVSAIPVADAGVDQTISIENTGADATASVTLHGTATSYHQGTLTYTWSGAATGSGQDLTVSLPFGIHTFTLTVTDIHGASDSDDVVVIVNAIPVANAGMDIFKSETYTENGLFAITLDGSASSDLETDALSYTWTGAATASGVNPTVNLPFGVHTMTLKVKDQYGASSTDSVKIAINAAPVANAGPDQIISSAVVDNGKVNVNLDGTASWDLEGETLTYTWSGPGGISATGATPTVQVPFGVTAITLTVTDPHGASSSSVVSIKVALPPIAKAGEDQYVENHWLGFWLKADVTLDGSASVDNTGSGLTYTWTGDIHATGVNPTVKVYNGRYDVTLTVTDAYGSSNSDNVTIYVGPRPVAVPIVPNMVLWTPGGSDVELDGSLSFSLWGGNPLTYKWTSPSFTGVKTGRKETVKLGYGTHVVTLMVTNEWGFDSFPISVSVKVMLPTCTSEGFTIVTSETYLEDAAAVCGAIGKTVALVDNKKSVQQSRAGYLCLGKNSYTWVIEDAKSPKPCAALHNKHNNQNGSFKYPAKCGQEKYPVLCE